MASTAMASEAMGTAGIDKRPGIAAAVGTERRYILLFQLLIPGDVEFQSISRIFSA